MKRTFGDKLRRAFPADGRGAAAAGDRLLDVLRRRHARERSESVARPEPVALPVGRVVDNERGICYLRELRYPVEMRHGAFSLGAARDAEPGCLAELARLDPAHAIDPDTCLFLDTETTGLSGGAGTVVFMTGMGFFEGAEFVLEQTFLRRYSEEPAALAHVAARLRQRPQLVTFVGKAFDRHRLAARMAVHGVRAGLFTSNHLDLYYMARRAWKHDLPDVKLQTVERRKLGVHRTDDMPGSQAPLAFLEWIRDATGPVDRVFEHNRLDVLTLVTMLAALGARA